MSLAEQEATWDAQNKAEDDYWAEPHLVTTPDKWHWMMEYCLKRRFPPAQEWAWKLAENAYNELVENATSI